MIEVPIRSFLSFRSKMTANKNRVQVIVYCFSVLSINLYFYVLFVKSLIVVSCTLTYFLLTIVEDERSKVQTIYF